MKSVEAANCRGRLPLGDQSFENALILARWNETRHDVTALRHLQRLPRLHSPQINAEILTELSDAHPIPRMLVRHVAQCSTYGAGEPAGTC